MQVQKSRSCCLCSSSRSLMALTCTCQRYASHLLAQQKSREVFLVGDMVESKATMFGKGKYFVFCYTEYDKSERRFWQVPKVFKFPKANQYTGWKYWMLVMLDYIENRFDGTIVAHPISSFWLFQDKMLPIALKTVFKNNCENNGLCYCEQRLPSFKMIATDPEEWYASRTDMLWFQASHCFANPKLWDIYDKLMILTIYSLLVNSISINKCIFM